MKPGDYVELHILDHIIGSKELVECFVSGVVVDADDHKVTLCYWTVPDGEFEGNDEHMTLLRVSVIKWRKVAKWGAWKLESGSSRTQ